MPLPDKLLVLGENAFMQIVIDFGNVFSFINLRLTNPNFAEKLQRNGLKIQHTSSAIPISFNASLVVMGLPHT